MSRTTLWIIAALGLAVVAVGCPPQTEQNVYDQGAYGESGGYSELEWSDFFGGAQQLADDFRFEATTTVTLVRWWGGYRDNIEHTDEFTVRIFADDDGMLPASPPMLEYHAGEVAREATGAFLEPGTWDLAVYEYSVALPSRVVDADTPCFLSIVNDTGRWMWAVNNSGEQGNEYSVARAGELAPWDTNGLDLAFELWSDK